MIVTGLEELTKSRSKVFLDGEFAFVLYKGELRHFHLKVDGEIAAQDYARIMEELLPKRAKLRAMNLLLKKDYTTAQLRKKLQEGGYPEEIISLALEYVQSYHYTDDQRYAVNYIVFHQDQKSKKRIEQDLRSRGISQEVMEKAWLQWEQEGGEQQEAEMISKLLRKRKYDSESATPAERQREYAFLMRKGFSSENVKKAVFGRHDTWMD